MNYLGRILRTRHLLFKDSPNGLIVPIDHGFTLGPIKGLSDMAEITTWIRDENISSIVAHKGMIENLMLTNALHPSTGVILHMTGMPTISNKENDKALLTQLSTAVKMGVDAVSIQLNYCEENFMKNMDILAEVVDDAHEHGLPLLLMLYDKFNEVNSEQKLSRIKTLVRIACEAGCDALKLGLPAETDELVEILSARLDSTKVFFAGGAFDDDVLTLCQKTQVAMSFGASGMCIGRNVFQAEQPREVVAKLADVIRQNSSVARPPIMELLKNSAVPQLAL